MSSKKGKKVTTRSRADDQDDWEIQAEGEESGAPAAGTSSDEERDAKVCALDGCTRPVFVDASTGRVHDYCGKTHARQAGALGDTAAVSDEVVAQLLARISALEQQSVQQPFQAAAGEEQGADVLYNLTHATAAEGFVHYPDNPLPRHENNRAQTLPYVWDRLINGTGSKHSKRDGAEVHLLYPIGSMLGDVTRALGDLAASDMSKAELVSGINDCRAIIEHECLERIYTRLDVLRQAPGDREHYERTIDPQSLTHLHGPPALTAGGRELDEKVATALVRAALRKATGEKDDDDKARARPKQTATHTAAFQGRGGRGGMAGARRGGSAAPPGPSKSPQGGGAAGAAVGGK